MWVIARTDPEDEDYPLPDILMNGDGSAKTFINEADAWKYMRKTIMEYDLPPELLIFDTIGLMRVH
ncbi:MAG: hypothetical protein CMN56_13980 [Sneathiella sp.]|jgi:hypothetical protein|uniref:hypothetical protein n=1 Tax=Sneathiella sp. TaxID=1964365 RepID=UPI000C6A4131|nr:hypothetical protein [Sneathiella sp.]MAZ04237.1 hypothetical protein [Sneathiella sp.]|tara:strand:- start:171 stop:368 length:198 start_codon:yes stop_codon:yes gene_type:complete